MLIIVQATAKCKCYSDFFLFGIQRLYYLILQDPATQVTRCIRTIEKKGGGCPIDGFGHKPVQFTSIGGSPQITVFLKTVSVYLL